MVRAMLDACDSRAAAAGVVSAAAAALTLTVAVVARNLSLVHAGEVVTHLVESCLIALPLDLTDVRGGEGELQLLRCEVEVAVRDLVLTHVEVSIPGIAGGARREGGESDLVGRRRHVVEEVEQHVVGFARA